MKVRIALFLLPVLAGSLLLFAQVKEFRPVTEAMLRNPAPGDWLNWRRTDNAWGYSPLNQINRQNVNQLQLAWSWSMDDTGANEATPLVYDGIMYLPNPRGVIQALDAATGDLIWQYRPSTAKAAEGSDAGRGIQRNIAIFGDKIFATTGDAHIIAVDARTGKLVWDTKVAKQERCYGASAHRLHPIRLRFPRQVASCSAGIGTATCMLTMPRLERPCGRRAFPPPRRVFRLRISPKGNNT